MDVFKDQQIVAMALLIVVVSASVVGLASSVKPPSDRKKAVPNSGAVHAVGIELYWDRQAREPVSSIGWGELEPGSSSSMTIYVKNEGDEPVRLGYYTSNWSPAEASNVLILGWDYRGQSVKAGKTLQVTLTLSASADAAGIGEFSFDLTIAGNP